MIKIKKKDIIRPKGRSRNRTKRSIRRKKIEISIDDVNKKLLSFNHIIKNREDAEHALLNIDKKSLSRYYEYGLIFALIKKQKLYKEVSNSFGSYISSLIDINQSYVRLYIGIAVQLDWELIKPIYKHSRKLYLLSKQDLDIENREKLTKYIVDLVEKENIKPGKNTKLEQKIKALSKKLRSGEKKAANTTVFVERKTKSPFRELIKKEPMNVKWFTKTGLAITDSNELQEHSIVGILHPLDREVAMQITVITGPDMKSFLEFIDLTSTE